MSDVRWDLIGQYPNAGQSFAQSFEQGQQKQQANIARQAMAALVQDPSNQRALQALARIDPAAAQQFQQQQLEHTRQLLAQHQDSIIKGAEIIRQFNPQDQPSYSAALAAAQQAGVDMSQVPQQYNPQYVQGIVHLADALGKPDAPDVQYMPLQPGGSVGAVDKRTGAARIVIGANPGDQQAGASMGPPQTAIDYLKANPNLAPHFDEKYGAGAAAKALGGQTPQASGGFSY